MKTSHAATYRMLPIALGLTLSSFDDVARVMSPLRVERRMPAKTWQRSGRHSKCRNSAPPCQRPTYGHRTFKAATKRSAW